MLSSWLDIVEDLPDGEPRPEEADGMFVDIPPVMADTYCAYALDCPAPFGNVSGILEASGMPYSSC